MSKHIPQSWYTCLLALFSSLVLFSGFNQNAWHAADAFQFEHHRIDTEGLVIGRLVQSRQAGIFLDGGFLGVGSVSGTVEDGAWETFEFQYEAYTNQAAFTCFRPYRSQSGVQGMWLGALDRLLGLNPTSKLALFHGLNSAMAAAVLSAIVVWFHLEFGFTAAAAAWLSIAACQWFPLLARNLYWSLWVFYLPMTACLFHLRRRPVTTMRDCIGLAGLVFGTLLLKCVLTGYEYITTTLVMTAVPVLYYGLARAHTVRLLVSQFVSVAGGSALAILLSALALCVQIGLMQGGLTEGIQHLTTAFSRRTTGGGDARLTGPPTGVILVIWNYLKVAFLDPASGPAGVSSQAAKWLFKIRYGHLTALFALASPCVLSRIRMRADAAERARMVALIWTVWFSVLAPLSWFVIFKEHSIVHARINPIVWQMPFTLFGSALCGLALKTIRPRHPVSPQPPASLSDSLSAG